MPDLLLELFSEEIPARMQKNAERDLADAFKSALAKMGFADGAITTYITPRRLALSCTHLPVAQPDISAELKGPKIDAPDAALQGFLKKNALALEQLEQRDGVYFAKIHQKGKQTAEILKDIIEKILADFPWPKSMRWGSGDVTWVRPLHSILCLFDGNIVPVEFGGVKAGSSTFGHRFLSPAKITIKTPNEYEKLLEKAHAIVDREKRKAQILKQAEAIAKAHGLTVKKDESLLDEVTGLVEWPMVLMGSIDAKFMDLPPEVLTMVMRSHQKYFSLVVSSAAVGSSAAKDPSTPLRSVQDDKLAPHFLIVSNMQTSDDGKAIIAGNERVLRARFSDARFFWDQDRKKPLDEWAQGLQNVTFHAKLGSVADKVERVKTLAEQLARYCHPAFIAGPPNNSMEIPQQVRDDVNRAATLCKADLVTGMVGEFAELQGVMGRYYALQQGEVPEIADAIRDHYKPQGPNDSVPTHPVSICVALADKLDTLISMFAIGEKPTGSKDPFALRRAALGVIRIVLENGIRLSLSVVIPAKAGIQCAASAAQEEKDLHRAHGALLDSRFRGNDNELLAFITDRLKVQLKDQGLRHDVINAVIANGDDDLVRIVARAKALQDFLATDNGANLLTAYKRAANILAIEEKKDKAAYSAADLNAASLKQTEEVELVAFLAKQAEPMENAQRNEQAATAMQLLAELRAPVDLFFDKIMVNCEDKELRANRLRLLASIKTSMDSIAHFALIEG